MKPYYQDDWVTIYHGDCREVFPSEQRDAACVITDPPYAETSLEWDEWQGGWLDSLGRAVDSLWCFGSLRMFMEHVDEFATWKLAQEIVWEKHNGSNAFADRFRRVHELAAHWYRGEWADVYHAPVYTMDATARTVRRKERPPQWGEIAESSYQSHDGGPRLQRSVIRVRSEHGNAQHPTQKPLGILTPIIEYSCPPGGIIYDPFCGSGSTLRAAKDAGRKAIGVDVNEAYCEIAAQRCAQEVLDFGASPHLVGAPKP